MRKIMEYNNFFNSLPKEKEEKGYISGSMFIEIAREYNEDIPKYGKYMVIRKESKLSTSRKDFFRDILKMFSSDIQKQIMMKCKKQ